MNIPEEIHFINFNFAMRMFEVPACLPLACAAHAHPRSRPELRISASFRPRFRTGLRGSCAHPRATGRGHQRSPKSHPVPPGQGHRTAPAQGPRRPAFLRFTPFLREKPKAKSKTGRKHGPGGGCADSSTAPRLACRARGSQGRAPGDAERARPGQHAPGRGTARAAGGRSRPGSWGGRRAKQNAERKPRNQTTKKH